jgi:hypothetical protein
MAKTFPQPRIYTTKEWGARPVAEEFETTHIEKSLLHHMDWPNRALISDHAKAVQKAFEVARSCQADHMDQNGWSDTGQNYTVSREGIICEGRHGSIAATKAGKNVVGAQCQGFNSLSCGTEHEGTYDDVGLPQVQWDAAVNLQCWILDCNKLSSSDIDGHRDHISTDCPGATFYSQLPKFREDVHTKLAKWRAENK